jgi:hypothetical protein
MAPEKDANRQRRQVLRRAYRYERREFTSLASTAWHGSITHAISTSGAPVGILEKKI